MWGGKAYWRQSLASFTPFKVPAWSLTMAERPLRWGEDSLIDWAHKKLFFPQEAKCLTETS
ncbi:MAG: hypothetical protein DBX00_12515 [Verrucomicrobia bacterium]|nr:MAG: hypothetical protein DBX00_12515 [Verrucomicrobiota bacterium]